MKARGSSKGTASGRGKGSDFEGAMLTGISSRSNDTAKTHRLFRDGNATEVDFKAAVDKDARALLGAQGKFAYASGGQLDWLDAIRPLTGCFEGFAVRESAGEDAVGPVTRWFRTNTFYRKPLVKGKIDCRGGELARILPNTGKDSVVFLPAPYSFVKLVENAFYESAEALAIDYARAVAKSVKRLEEKGYKCVVLAEPFVGYELSKGKCDLPEWFSKSLSIIEAPEVMVGINFPLAEPAEIMLQIEESTVDFIGIDATFASHFKIDTGKDVLLGVVDGARPVIETKKDIEGRIKQFVSQASFSGRYYIGPNDRLYDVPFEIALKKIEALGSFGGV